MLALNYCSYFQQSFTAVGYNTGIMNPPLSHAPSWIHKQIEIYMESEHSASPEDKASKLLGEHREKSNQAHRQEGKQNYYNLP
jgi:hypothetical protein